MADKRAHKESFFHKALNFTGIGQLIKYRSSIKKYITDKEFRKWVKDQDIMDPVMYLAAFYAVALSVAAFIIIITK